jgi:hypothetical protein
MLARDGNGLPVTVFAHDPKRTEEVLKVVGGAPVVIKSLEGTQGIGVVLADALRSAKSVVEAFRGAQVNILVQEFINEASGEDIRAFVVGGKVVAAMRRTGAEGEFRSSLHRGGSAKPIKITAEERSTAVRAAKAMGLNGCGVDMLRSNHGPVVMEVNSSPGLEGVEKTTGINVAGLIIDFIERHATPLGSRPARGHPAQLQDPRQAVEKGERIGVVSESVRRGRSRCAGQRRRPDHRPHHAADRQPRRCPDQHCSQARSGFRRGARRKLSGCTGVRPAARRQRWPMRHAVKRSAGSPGAGPG